MAAATAAIFWHWPMGGISTNLPTTPGATYTLTFQYRGPGIAGWWRGESNVLDLIGGNIGTTPNGINYAPPWVGNYFHLNGVNQFVLVNPAAPASLDVGQGSGLTIEGWIKPTTSSQMCLAEYERVLGGVGTDVGVQFFTKCCSLPWKSFCQSCRYKRQRPTYLLLPTIC